MTDAPGSSTAAARVRAAARASKDNQSSVAEGKKKFEVKKVSTTSERTAM